MGSRKRKLLLTEKGEPLLKMECGEEELSPAQAKFYRAAEDEYVDFCKKYDYLLKGETLVDKGKFVTLLELTSGVQSQAAQTANASSSLSALLTNPGQQKTLRGSGPRPKTTQWKSSNQTPGTPGVPQAPRILFPTNLGGVQKIQIPKKTLDSEVGGFKTAPPVKRRRVIYARQFDSNVVDLTDDDGCSDSKEVTINKIPGKTYPSLVVVARPSLSKDVTQNFINAERKALDAKVKQTLLLPPNHFTEWLLQKGIIRCEQFCPVHTSSNKSPEVLKLGIYSETSKFPHSGGYVWINECCAQQQFVSVFAGSIFENVSYPPTAVLKLIYHWACHTLVQNVVQWVKVDNLFIKTLYTNLRAVCTAAVHQKFVKMGGLGQMVQIAVISLGTTTGSSGARQVKVEVLGVCDMRTKQMRIRAIEPLQDPSEADKCNRKRFLKILDPLQNWVDKDSILVIDYTVDKATLHHYGYQYIEQKASSAKQKGQFDMMDYLKNVVPRMFQNTLSLLSRQIIQQFLDELVWREAYGSYAAKAFDSIIEHLAEQTKLKTGDTLLNRLSKISANPFKNWRYDRWAANCKTSVDSNGKERIQTTSPMSAGSSSTSSLGPLNNLSPVVTSTPRASTAPLATLSTDSTAVPPPLVPITSSVTLSHVRKPPGIPAYPRQLESNDGKGVVEKQAAVVPLEPYYYGTITVNEGLTCPSTAIPFTCVLCAQRLPNNIALTDHLIAHTFNKDMSGELKDVCRRCCNFIGTADQLKPHLQSHKDGRGFTCHICSIKLKDRTGLVTHMVRTHRELDLPYLCEACGFRTSLLEMFLSHFNNIHKNTDVGMCPYCMKMVKFNGKNGQHFFISHLQRHLLPTSKKCSRCTCWFVSRDALQEHEENRHISIKPSETRVMRYIGNDTILMPAPLVDPPPLLLDKVQPTPSSSTYKFVKPSLFRKLTFDFDEDEGCRCHECEGPISLDHYNNPIKCTKCKYTTCCLQGMTEHMLAFHADSSSSKRFIIGKKVALSTPAVCVCGFQTTNGNVMATHTWECGSNRCIQPSTEFRDVQG